MRFNPKTSKLIFDVRNRPNLRKAIVRRLAELGGRVDTPADCSGEPRPNVSLNWGTTSIYSGAAHAGASCFDGHRLTTLDELYDIELVCTQDITINGVSYAVSEEAYRKIFKLANERPE